MYVFFSYELYISTLNFTVIGLQAPELLTILFNIGSRILLRELPSILDGTARLKAQAQDHSKATLAPKVMSTGDWAHGQLIKLFHFTVINFYFLTSQDIKITYFEVWKPFDHHLTV
ncbi:hypothetical protein Cni_G06317 [Canna indica]|uniref:Uncharacterized protein n=1 Tax=Canna indica TaxID=4628 RepID=A0AAQ3JWA6_9LILI|nr:hypothetical protein Cni_G06317 [Canna indica]